MSCPTSSFPTSAAHQRFVMAAAATSDLVLSLGPLFDPSHKSIQDESSVKMGACSHHGWSDVGNKPTLHRVDCLEGLVCPPRISLIRCSYHVHRKHRIAVQKHLGEGSVSMRVEKVLARLVESGVVYCCLWVCHHSNKNAFAMIKAN